MKDIKVVPASMEEYKALLKRDFPELVVSQIEYLGSGWGNAAILVNQKFVFRFPRGLFEKAEPLNSDVMQKEVNLLKFLQGKTSFSIPVPVFVAPGSKYFGYELLEGSLWDHIDQKERFSDSILNSWVRVRSELAQAVPVKKAKELGVPYYQNFTGKNIKNLNKYLNDEKADPRVKEMAIEARDYLNANLRNDGNWVFIHEDLQMSNCFVDGQPREITGVIDFEETEIGPVEADFYFWSKYGKETLHKVADMQEAYDGTKIDPKLARCMHQFYIVADYVDFTERGFSDSAAHKWEQIKAYL